MNAVSHAELAALPQRAATAAHDAELAANSALLVAQSFIIDSPEVYEAAGVELREIAGRMKRLEDARLSITRPMDAAKKAVMDLFAKPMETLQQADKALRASMLAWKRAEDERIARERAEAERIAREEREAAQRAAAEAAARAAELAAQGDAEQAAAAAAEAEAAAEEAALAEVAPPPAVVGATKAEGVATRKVWKAEVVDFAALVKAAATDATLMAYLEVNTTALNGVAKAMKDAARIPGVRVYADETLAVRRA